MKKLNAVVFNKTEPSDIRLQESVRLITRLVYPSLPIADRDRVDLILNALIDNRGVTVEDILWFTRQITASVDALVNVTTVPYELKCIYNALYRECHRICNDLLTAGHSAR